MVKQLSLHLTQIGKGDWGIAIVTSEPQCSYYFGHFATIQEAEVRVLGFVDNLLEAGFTRFIQSIIKQCYLIQLTVQKLKPLSL
ncbi:DUF1816 domain-containing protein [Leptolyngbya sp. KIOST-1]|uniref:DUF1816 domain-containing protein n=1 Tax=Leptolyngbya sp. KIOST-1 TaxID=1229172 RepID=UPI000562F742|nr:DUF1816 domain-containing protein [Leptolyngbya sp. KIOST-1]